MISKTCHLLALVAFAAASCHIEPSWEANQPQTGYWSNAGLSLESCAPQAVPAISAPQQVQETIAAPAPRLPGRIVSNECKCVKTIVRPKLVTRVSVVPTERRQIQTINKPVVQRVQYTFSPPLSTGPSASSSVVRDNAYSALNVAPQVYDFQGASQAYDAPADIVAPQSLSCEQPALGLAPAVLPQPEINIPRPSLPGRIVSNDCKCVKIILRPRLVSSVVVKPVERKTVQTYTKPVTQKIQYNFTPALSTGPQPQVNQVISSEVPTGYAQAFNTVPQECESQVLNGNYNYPEIKAEPAVNYNSNVFAAQCENSGLENLSRLPSCLSA